MIRTLVLFKDFWARLNTHFNFDNQFPTTSKCHILKIYNRLSLMFFSIWICKDPISEDTNFKPEGNLYWTISIVCYIDGNLIWQYVWSIYGYCSYFKIVTYIFNIFFLFIILTPFSFIYNAKNIDFKTNKVHL